MKKTPFLLLARSLAFFAPLMILLIVVFGGMASKGEFLSLAEVHNRQSVNSKLVWQRAYLDQEYESFKRLGIQRRKPEVLVLGSSTSMQIRSWMSSQDEQRFYNAGGILQSPEAIIALVNDIPKSTKLVILVWDHWWWRTAEFPSSEPHKQEAARQWEFQLSAFRQAVQKRLKGLFGPGNENGIGVAAQQGSGFRADGSMKYSDPPVWTDSNPYQDTDRYPFWKRLRDKKNQFVGWDGSIRRRPEVEEALKRIMQGGAKLWILLPPSDEKLRAEFGQDFLQKEDAAFHEMAKTIGATAFNATGLSTLGLTENSMLDGIHPGETAMLLALRKLADLDSSCPQEIKKQLNSHQMKHPLWPKGRLD